VQMTWRQWTGGVEGEGPQDREHRGSAQGSRGLLAPYRYENACYRPLAADPKKPVTELHK